MARQALVVDASVVVKWFSAPGEASVAQAVDIMENHAREEILLAVPDLLYYEVANALAYNSALSAGNVQLAVRRLFALRLQTWPTNAELMAASLALAREHSITVYDACYVALAEELGGVWLTFDGRAVSRLATPELACDLTAGLPEGWDVRQPR